MPGTRQPLSVIDAKGKKHLTKAEHAAREESEIKAEAPKYVLPPKYLPEGYRKEFSEISRQLIALKIFTKLDRDTLAAYLIARQNWLQATAYVNQALNPARPDPELAQTWAGVQDKFFKQARAAANDLGLTVTSRCKLVLPRQEQEEDDPLDSLLSRRHA